MARTAREVVADRIRATREGTYSLRELTHRLHEIGVDLNPNALSRIERGERELKVDELLAIAAALEVSPGHLVAPAYGDGVRVGNRALSATQVLAWFAGDVDALDRTTKTFEELAEETRNQRFLSDLLQVIDGIGTALAQRDRPAAIMLTAHATYLLADASDVLTSGFLTQEDRNRIVAEYDLPRSKGDA